MVFEVPISGTVGLPTYYSGVAYYKNIGSLNNKGIEFTVAVDAIKTKDTQLTFTLNGSHNKNTLTKLSNDNPIIEGSQIRKVGNDIYTFYLKEWAGVDPQTGVGTWYKGKEGKEVTTDYNEAKEREVGKASPDFQGGFKTDFRYKNFDVSFQLGCSLGGKIYGNHLRYDEQVGNGFGNNYIQYVADNRWKKPGDNALVPMMVDDPKISWNKSSTRFLMDGSYLKLQNIMLGYTFRGKSFKTIGLSSVRVFVSGENLFTLTAKNYRGFDPASVAANGIAWWNYPVPARFTAGVSLGF